MSTAFMDSNRRAAKLQLLVLVLISALLLPILYALSYGPAYYFAEKVDLDPESAMGIAFSSVYTPLGWYCENNKTAQQFFGWYMPLWGSPW